MYREPHVFVVLGISKTQTIKAPVKDFVRCYQKMNLSYEDLTKWSPQKIFTRQLRSLGGVMRKKDAFLDFKKFEEKERLLSREDFRLKVSSGEIERLQEANYNTRKIRGRPIKNKITSLLSSVLTEEERREIETNNESLLRTLSKKLKDENQLKI